MHLHDQGGLLIEEAQKECAELSLDIGCGKIKRATFGMDHFPGEGVDIVGDANDGIPFPDSSLERIVMFHSLEHVLDPVFVMTECARVLQPGGVLEIKVPHHSNVMAYQIHHRSYWNLFSFDPLVMLGTKSNEQFALFSVEKLIIRPYFPSFSFMAGWLSKHRYLYEFFLWHIIPAYEIDASFKKV